VTERLKPPALPEHATIAVVAPASPPQTRSEIEQATAYFEALGHRVVFGPNHRKVHGYLAGTDEERAADLQWALSEPGIDMIHTLCGGYGTARLHDRIEWSALGTPRIVCGFSDITALHLALATHAGWVTFYGPNFVRFTRRKDELTDETKQWFHRALAPEPLGRVFEDPEDPYVLTVGEGVADRRAPRRHRHPLDRQLSERHLEVLDDLRPLVGASEDGAELAGLVVLELEHSLRFVVVHTREHVELPHAVHVLDDGHAGAVVGLERELRPDAGKTCLFQLRWHLVSFSV